MSFTKSLVLMALASGVLAAPGLRHVHQHPRSIAYGTLAAGSQTTAPYPYPVVNSTVSSGPTGTGHSPYQVSSSPIFSTASIPASSPSSLGGSSSVSPSQSTPIENHSPSKSSAPSSVSVPAPAATSATAYHIGEDDDSCIPNDTTSTVTVSVYVTVDAEPSSSSHASSTSVPPAIAIPSNVVAVSSSHLLSSKSYSAPVAPSSFSAAEASHVSQPVTVSSHAVAVSSSTTSATPTSTPSGDANTGKRGLAYEDASLTQPFAGQSQVSWAYNWGCTSGDLPKGIKYIPTLWGASSRYTSVWNDDAKKAISNGAEYLFSFNEPDMPAQANLSPEAAAAAYKQWMQPFAGQAKLGAPSVTNSGADNQGLSFMSKFLSACDGCQVDFINIHWYAELGNPSWDAAQGFKSHVQDAIQKSGGKPVFVTEFGPSDNTNPSDAVITAFLEDVMSWMDAQPSVLGYSYFMVEPGKLLSGSSLSSYGKTYATYTS